MVMNKLNWNVNLKLSYIKTLFFLQSFLQFVSIFRDRCFAYISSAYFTECIINLPPYIQYARHALWTDDVNNRTQLFLKIKFTHIYRNTLYATQCDICKKFKQYLFYFIHN